MIFVCETNMDLPSSYYFSLRDPFPFGLFLFHPGVVGRFQVGFTKKIAYGVFLKKQISTK